jgi:hypothetical protein
MAVSGIEPTTLAPLATNAYSGIRAVVTSFPAGGRSTTHLVIRVL